MTEGVPALRELLARAARAGLEVRWNGGDVIVCASPRYIRVNSRRKDGTPRLLKAVRAAEERGKLNG
jgi:hypothetical protein